MSIFSKFDVNATAAFSFLQSTKIVSSPATVPTTPAQCILSIAAQAAFAIPTAHLMHTIFMALSIPITDSLKILLELKLASSELFLTPVVYTYFPLSESSLTSLSSLISRETVAAGFPTTVAPVIQYGAVPVFVDVAIPQYNIDPNLLEQAVSEKTKAVMLAHTLGNPFDLKAVKDFCDRHNLWLIEDNCDALGSRYTIDGESRLTGTIGDIGTSSFYPPHHMTMGEGGAVYTKNPLLHKIVRSFRDWGRDCVCAPGQDNLCGHRFDRQYGELPLGYDHKYVYSHFGYNLKATDMQAAVGCAQLRKFPSFVERRIHNFNYLKEALKGTEDKLILPEACENSEPSWFGFLITCREGVDRNQLVQKIEEKGVQTRMLFAGNLIKHPCFDQMRATGKGYRVAGSLENTDRIMTDTFWIGVYPGMTDAMLDAMADAIKEALE